MRSRPYRTFTPVLVGIIAVMTLNGCSTDSAPNNSQSASAAETDSPTQVVAAIAPLAEIVTEIAREGTIVTTLAAPGVEPHDLELTATQVNAIEDADLVVYLRGLIPQVDEAVKNRKGTSLDVLNAVDLLKVDGTVDPHVWLDPSRFAKISEAIGGSLATSEPTKLKTYLEKINTLEAEFESGLKNCKHREIVTGHDAFGYLATKFGLTQVSVSGLSPEAEPSPNRMAEITDVIKRTGATTVFAESEEGSDFAEALAREAGVQVATLSPMESIPTGSSYFSVMRNNLAALRTALVCT
jgi:zinc transport system substrate-binding protein